MLDTTHNDRVIRSTHASTFNYVHDFQKSEIQPAFSHRFSIAKNRAIVTQWNVTSITWLSVRHFQMIRLIVKLVSDYALEIEDCKLEIRIRPITKWNRL